MTDDLIEFIRARLDEQARQFSDIHDTEVCALVRFRDAPCDCGEPAHVLRGVEAKRRVLNLLARSVPSACDCEAYGHHQDADDLLRLLASEWSDHTDYQQEWTP